MRTRTSFLDRFLATIETKKPSDTLLLRLLFFVTVASGLFFLITLNTNLTTKTPGRGGTLMEGIVGIPRFVNPALAITRADQDTVGLIYSGLMKIDEKGDLIPDLAQSITLSEDKRTYTIILKKDKTFHDTTPLTTHDVVFTINLIRDPDLKSPLRGNWSDVTVEATGEYEMQITLLEPYTPFIENFTFGVMPQHIWSHLRIEQLPFSQYNTEPIGSGPFMITAVNRDTTGLISGYELTPATGDNTPNLDSIELKFFQNEERLKEALLTREINSTVFLPNEYLSELNPDKYQIRTMPLPRVFSIFFNQNRSPALRDKAARAALSAAIDRESLVRDVLYGQGVPTTLPIVKEHHGVSLSDTVLEQTASFSSKSAEVILVEGGWKKNNSGGWEKKIDQVTETLDFTIRAENSKMSVATLNAIAENWRRIGIAVQIEQYEQNGLVQSVIRSRDFEALLFGQDMNRLQDLYPFWHSSQKDDPGLNIAQYTNVTVDGLLEEARSVEDPSEQLRLLKETSEIIEDEIPAIFLYAPSVTYVIDKEITSAPMVRLGRPSDRFMNIANWHARTDVVWPLFEQK